jgi:hypothetical protein
MNAAGQILKLASMVSQSWTKAQFTSQSVYQSIKSLHKLDLFHDSHIPLVTKQINTYVRSGTPRAWSVYVSCARYVWSDKRLLLNKMREIIEAASEWLWLTEARGAWIVCRALFIAIYMFNEGSRFQPASQTTNYLPYHARDIQNIVNVHFLVFQSRIQGLLRTCPAFIVLSPRNKIHYEKTCTKSDNSKPKMKTGK